MSNPAAGTCHSRLIFFEPEEEDPCPAGTKARIAALNSGDSSKAIRQFQQFLWAFLSIFMVLMGSFSARGRARDSIVALLPEYKSEEVPIGTIPNELISQLKFIREDSSLALPDSLTRYFFPADRLDEFLRPMTETEREEYVPGSVEIVHWDEGDLDGDGQAELFLHGFAENSIDIYWLLKKENGKWHIRDILTSHGRVMGHLDDPVFSWHKKEGVIRIPRCSGWGLGIYWEEQMYFRWHKNELQYVLDLPALFWLNSAMMYGYGTGNRYVTKYSFNTPDTIMVMHTYTEEAGPEVFPRQWKLKEDQTVFEYSVQVKYVWNADSAEYLPLQSEISPFEKVFIGALHSEAGQAENEAVVAEWNKWLNKRYRYLQTHGNRYQRWYYRQLSDEFRALKKGRGEL